MIEMDPAKQFEDLFSKKGIPTHCIQRPRFDADTDDVGGLAIEVVIPMNTENTIFSLANSLMPSFVQIAGKQVRMQFRTILFHLARERFGTSSTGNRTAMSVNVVNLQNPAERVEPKTRAKIYTYDVDLVAIASPSPALESSLRKTARERVGQFNSESRFLRIGKLRLGFTRSRFVQSAINFSPI